MNTEPPELAAFLDNLRAKNSSAHTQEAYRRDLNEAWHFLQKQQLQHWQDAQAQHIRLWLAQQHAQGRAPRTLARRLAALRALYKHLRQSHGMTHDPCQGLRLPRANRHLPATLESENLSRLLDSPTKQEAPNALQQRDLAIFELLYGSGLRLSEACQLNLNDLDLTNGEARIHGKGNKTRIVPLGSQAIQALQTWLPMRQNFAPAGEIALFLSQQKRRITPRSVQNRLSQLAQQRGIQGKPHPHMLRHACASHLLQNSGDLRAVQELLGHENLSTTQIYTHLDFQHLAKIYDEAHPRARRDK